MRLHLNCEMLPKGQGSVAMSCTGASDGESRPRSLHRVFVPELETMGTDTDWVATERELRRLLTLLPPSPDLLPTKEAQ